MPRPGVDVRSPASMADKPQTCFHDMEIMVHQIQHRI